MISLDDSGGHLYPDHMNAVNVGSGVNTSSILIHSYHTCLQVKWLPGLKSLNIQFDFIVFGSSDDFLAVTLT